MFSSPARFASPVTVFLVAVALRLAAAFVLGDLPISRMPQLDSAAYVSWARALVDEPSFWPAYPEHAPGYPIFVAIVLALSGGSLMAVRIVQAILGAIGCVLTARIASRTLTPKAFLPAGLLQASYAPLIYIDTALLAEGLFVFLLIAVLALATSARTRRHWLLCGAVLGVAAVVRPTALVLLPAFAIVLALRTNRARAMASAIALAAGTAVVVTPVVVQNWRVTGLPMVQAYAGLNVYLGNRPSGNGMAAARLGGEWDALEGEASRAGADRNAQDQYYIRKTLREIADEPRRYAGLLASKVLWATQDEELRDTHSYHFFERAWPMLAWLPGFGVMAALAAAGLTSAFAKASASTRTAADGEGLWLLIAYLAAMLVTVVFLVVGTRYRMPLVPAVIACGGAGVAAVLDRIRSRDWRGVGILAVIVAVTFAACNLRTDAASRNVAEEYAFTGLSLLQEGKIEEAETTSRAAIRMGDSSFAWDALGMVLLRRQLRNDAREAFERAVYINEKNATAWMHLGLAYEFLGNRPGALDSYRMALRITPERSEAKQLLQDALLRPPSR